MTAFYVPNFEYIKRQGSPHIISLLPLKAMMPTELDTRNAEILKKWKKLKQNPPAGMSTAETNPCNQSIPNMQLYNSYTFAPCPAWNQTVWKQIPYHWL